MFQRPGINIIYLFMKTISHRILLATSPSKINTLLPFYQLFLMANLWFIISMWSPRCDVVQLANKMKKFNVRIILAILFVV